MKKHIYTGIFLFLMGIGTVHAQDTQLFRFVSQRAQNGTRLVLHHNLEDNSVGAVPLSNPTFNRTDGYLQAFILQPVTGRKGEVLIASAKAPEYFLKVENNDLSFEKIENQNLNGFKWSISFLSQENFNGQLESNIAIVTPDIINNLGVRVASEDNVIALVAQTNQDTFVFTMQRVTNVF